MNSYIFPGLHSGDCSCWAATVPLVGRCETLLTRRTGGFPFVTFLFDGMDCVARRFLRVARALSSCYRCWVVVQVTFKAEAAIHYFMTPLGTMTSSWNGFPGLVCFALDPFLPLWS